MNEWVSIKEKLPKLGQFVITSVRDANYCYHEVLKISEETKNWVNHDGIELNSKKKVIGWMDLPSSYIE